MRKNLLTLFILFLTIFSGKAADDIGRQLWKNSNLGWNVRRTEDYRWRNFFIGTAYSKPIDVIPKSYWLVGLNVNWSKYTLYSTGDYAMGGNNAILKTTSLSFPVIMGYQFFKQKGFGLNLYTGPTFELIVGSKLDGYEFDDVNIFQPGWTVGSVFQFFYLFRARLAYNYYPAPLLTNHDMLRSAITFSIGF